MVEIIKDILLPIIAIILSTYAIYQTGQANQKAEQSTKEAEKATNIANRISNGQIELNIAALIIETENRTMDLSIEMAKYFKDNLEDYEKKQLEFLKIAHDQAIESNLNAYEEACAKYLDEKTDKERFKRMYNVPIRRLLDGDELKKYFDPITSSFKCILKVYNEWNNLENDK